MTKRQYDRTPEWVCPSCGESQFAPGHHCLACHRRVCGPCFSRDRGQCKPWEYPEKAHETCSAAQAKPKVNKHGRRHGAPS